MTNHDKLATALAPQARVVTQALRQAESRSTLTLGQGFLRSVALYPEASALAVGDHWLSYRQLDAMARSWAATLQKNAGAAPLRRIGVLGNRSLGVYAGILASVLLGATFVPLNASFPIERTVAMCRAAKLDALIVDEAALKLLRDLDPAALPRLILAPLSEAEEGASSILRKADLLAGVDFSPRLAAIDDIAYILFTSGSTGSPKGVPISHGNLAHFLSYNIERYAVTSLDRLSQTFEHTFDLAMFDMFMGWWTGACVCAVSSLELLAPARYIATKGITLWFSVPSVARLLLQGRRLQPGSFPGLRLSLFCGEGLGKAVAEAWAAAAPYSVLENVYGPTELTIACSAYRWDPVTSPAACHNDLVPLGQLYPHLSFAVVGENQAPVVEGEIGELCVDGPQRFGGYLDDPVRTEAASLRLGTSARQYYRTGDLVFVNAQGDLCYVGRKDRQVKIGGFRVELAEVEGELRKLAGMIEAVVVAVKDESDPLAGSELVAFVMTDGLCKIDIDRALKRVLPGYMIPRKIHLRRDFPLNSNDKIDRSQLLITLQSEGA